MRYAVLADVHSNVDALASVLDAISRDGVDDIVCLGDIVGYNASPNECVALLRSHSVRSISGNHDRAALGKKDTTRFGAAARRAIEWTRSALVDDSRAFLAALPPHLLVDDRFFAVHGALHPEPNDDLHLSNDARVGRSFEELVTGRFGSKLCFFGHSHRPAIYEYRDGVLRQIRATEAAIRPDAFYLINPGSVGQPRDRDSRAAYALFDVDQQTVRLRRVPYAVTRTECAARAAGLVSSASWLGSARDRIQVEIDRIRDHFTVFARVTNSSTRRRR